jgi:hypothetical protein
MHIRSLGGTRHRRRLSCRAHRVCGSDVLSEPIQPLLMSIGTRLRCRCLDIPVKGGQVMQRLTARVPSFTYFAIVLSASTSEGFGMACSVRSPCATGDQGHWRLKYIRYLALLIVVALVSTAASATISPCTNDRLKFCKDVKASPEDIRGCLLQHKDELSEACKARLGASSKAMP